MNEYLFFNGINGDSGEYALPPMTGESLAQFIQGQSPPENLNELRLRYRQAHERTLGVKEGVDPLKLDQAGWGVIFTHDADPTVKEALHELLALRRAQAGPYFRLFEGPNGYRPGESKASFLARHGVGPGPVDPEKVPYYLLIVGSLEEIPFRFQSQLDVQYAVGRISFANPQEYAHYARNVCEAEEEALNASRRAVFFSVDNRDDQSTRLSTELLLEPLYQAFKAKSSVWEFEAYFKEQATKSQLAHLLGGAQTPALLFTAGHGMEFPLGSPRQLPHQGALLCQDWPGPLAWDGKGAIPQDLYFAGDDLTSGSNLHGMVAFFFACYSAGTPPYDEFSRQAFKKREAIAPHPFTAQLPARLLSHPKGGALAVIGHMGRTWGYSFMWPQAGAQTAVFEGTLQRLFDGHPVGSAVEFFNQRYAELSTVLSDELEEIEFGKRVDPYELAGLWTAHNDARGYAVLGDPAVRLKPD
jgi:hypothetical protein